MTRADLTEKLLDIKREKGWTWKYICEQIGGMSPVMITGGSPRQQKMTKPMADAAAKLFGLTKSEQALLNEVPMRGTGTPMPPTDPLIYRFYELVMVNGPAWKALIEEEFGDGIMSAIDFDMTIDRQSDPKGDRVKIGMTGKFLPFKYYGATGNALPYGLKEEGRSPFALARWRRPCAAKHDLRTDIGHSRRAGKRHRNAEFFLKDVDCLCDAGFAAGTKPVDVSTPDQTGPGAERQRAQHVGTRADATIKKHLGVRSDRLRNCRKRRDG